MPVGVVLSQQPAPGEEIGEEKVIILTVSKGSQLATMPDLMGLPRVEAEKILTDAGIMFETMLQNGLIDTPVDLQIVINTVPTAGSILFKTDEKALLTVAPKSEPDTESERSST
jgi:beta-lactam-binding protein with PASTA domain